MDDLTTVEIKAFAPARDFRLAKQFYQDLGFAMAWSDETLAYFHHGNAAFLLQNFCERVHADTFLMHILVRDVDAWWRHVASRDLASKYGLVGWTIIPLSQAMGRDFAIVDPSGVLWRIGQNISSQQANT